MSDTITQLAVEHLRAYEEYQREFGPFGVMPEAIPNYRRLETLRICERDAWRKYRQAQDESIRAFVNRIFALEPLAPSGGRE